MFCYQCEQTEKKRESKGCLTIQGTCGKNEVTSDLQDILIYQLKGIAQYATRARNFGVFDKKLDAFLVYALFTTLTNVNFNATRFQNMIREAEKYRNKIRDDYLNAMHQSGKVADVLSGPAIFEPAEHIEELLKQASIASLKHNTKTTSDNIMGLRALILYGMKGVAAYTYHARVLGFQDDDIDAGIESMLNYLAEDPSDFDELLEHALDVGRLNLQVMKLLDTANTESYGNQEITSVRTTPVKGKAILVSGHDFRDLKKLLELTKDENINIYTHGEMLPAHAYPKLKQYPHLSGNWGGAWQEQQREFSEFPGPILMTSNCLIEPSRIYKNRIFTTGPVGWPGVRHIDDGDFSTLIQAAKALPGFQEDGEDRNITIGFGRHTVLSVADQVIDAVKNGDIRHFFLVGGCDGSSPLRQYYTDIATQAPKDTIILTLGCGKYRFNKQEFGSIGGIPRLLDAGQCSDAYSAIEIASALANALACDVNELPLSFMISWFEQKATAVLLTLLSLGIRGIYWGPTLPGYITPTLAEILQKKFDLKLINDATTDLKAELA